MNTTHIFTGEINKEGAAVGFHHISGQLGGYARVVRKVATKSNNNEWGAYVALVDVFNGSTWIRKKGKGLSTMFPDHWSAGKVMDEVLHAKNTGAIVDGVFTGTATNGMPIKGYINNFGKIISAFPNIL